MVSNPIRRPRSTDRRLPGPQRATPTRLAVRGENHFDALEARQLLVADLGIQFIGLAELPATSIPGDTVPAVVRIINEGDTQARGKVTVRFYLSTNETFDAEDTLMGTVRDRQVQLFSNQQDEFDVNLRIPTVVPGSYFFLVRIEPESAIGDTNQTNHVASRSVDGRAQPVAWMFGSFGLRRNAILTLTEADGKIVQFGLDGGGSGTVVRDATDTDRFDVTVTDSVAASRMGIGADGGTGANADIALIDDVTVTGSLTLLDASSARLLGDVRISGTAGTIRFHDVMGPSLIEIGTAGANTALTLGVVRNLVLTSAGGLASLTVTSWTDTDTALDRISAAHLTSLTSAGAFQPSITLRGRAGGRTLDVVNISGTLSKGAWDIDGRAGRWSIKAVSANWSASIRNNLVSFSVERIFRGTLAAKAFTTITTGGLVNARILAGADLGADARLGGTDAAVDTFSSGTINTIQVNGKVTNAIVGAGLNPTDGRFKDGNDQLLSGRINSIVVTRTASPGTRFLARRFSASGPYRINGVDISTATDQRFKLDPATPPTFSEVKLDPEDAPTKVGLTLTDNQAIDVSTLGNGDLVLKLPDGSTVALSYIFPVTPPVNGPSVMAEYVISPPGGAWDTADNGTYEVLIAADQIRDTFGAAMAAGVVATFTIAL